MTLPSRVCAGLLLAVLAPLAGCTLLPTLTGPPPVLSPPPSIGEPTPGRDLRGVIHLHSYLSHDSDGSIERIAELALGAGCDFVALTDHHPYDPPLPPPGPRGYRDGVLFLPGSETSGGHGSVLGIDLQGPLRLPMVRGWAQQQVERVREAGGVPLIGHCESFEPWETEGWRGMEIANLHPMAVEASKPGTAFAFLFYPPNWFFARLTRQLNPRVLARWDELGRARAVPGFGGCDVHENIRLLGPLGLTIGTYAEGFRAVTTHLIVRSAGAAGVREALLAGRGYVAFEIWGSATGFRFALFARDGRLLDAMGAERRFEAGAELRAAAPGGARLRLLRDGKEVASGFGQLRHAPTGPGVYRIEAWLGDDPFVLSNPIYLRAGAGSAPPSAAVEVEAPASR